MVELQHEVVHTKIHSKHWDLLVLLYHCFISLLQDLIKNSVVLLNTLNKVFFSCYVLDSFHYSDVRIHLSILTCNRITSPQSRLQSMRLYHLLVLYYLVILKVLNVCFSYDFMPSKLHLGTIDPQIVQSSISLQDQSKIKMYIYHTIIFTLQTFFFF